MANSKNIEKIDYRTLELHELLEYIKAIDTVCSMYENSVRMYDGGLKKDSDEIVKKSSKYSLLKQNILDEIECRIKKLL